MQQPTPIQRALARFDNSPTKLARAIGGDVKRQHIEHWLKSGNVPTEHVRPMAEASEVPCWDFRPDDWHRIWPDLIGAAGAPEPSSDRAHEGGGAAASQEPARA